MKRTILICLFFMFPLIAQASHGHDLSGEYSVSGHDPFLATSYAGTAVIVKSGDTYQINYTFVDPNTQALSYGVGTGVVIDNIFAVSIEDLYASPSFGVDVYEIHENKLVGKWTYIGQTLVGTEKLKRIIL
jgi:hypothetical protein